MFRMNLRSKIELGKNSAKELFDSDFKVFELASSKQEFKSVTKALPSSFTVNVDDISQRSNLRNETNLPRLKFSKNLSFETSIDF